MTLDETTQKLFNQYHNLDRVTKEFEINPSTDNYQLREKIKDPSGKEMITQPVGLVKKQLESNLVDTIHVMNSSVDAGKYEGIKKEFYNPLDEGFKRHAYLEIAQNVVKQFLNEEEFEKLSDDLKSILGLVGFAENIQEDFSKKDYESAIKLMNKAMGGEQKSDLAYHYNAIGQRGNVEAIGNHLIQIQKNIAMNNVSDKVKAEIDNIVKEKNAYGVAGAEMYKVYNSYREQQEALAKQKAKE